ncbi:hypothetical protein LWI28_017603 [Acer negundo]|uniref:MATH domain-containing protein n=1 Tax=Acer negundo TaxID=4023 RepID=A0AAD5JP94_ACENE|nr:hypothetical protein LWI28_017603 [Acer negundo]
MMSSKAKDKSFILQKLGILAFICPLYITYKADWGDLFTYNSVENIVAMASFVDEQDGVVRFISDAPASSKYTNHCFTAARSFCGWQKFITPSYLNDPGNGCIVKDVCVVKAEVNVWGCQSSTADMMNKKCNRSCNFLPYDQELSVDHSFVLSMPDKYDFTSILSVCLHLVLCMGKILAYKADWGDLLTYNSVENFVAMASFVDEQDGVVRFISDAPPTHYKLKIQLFSLLVKNAVEKYESAEFEAGGYIWKIQLNPKGRHHGNGSHLSLYLVMAESTTLSPASNIYAEFTLRILDQVQARHIAGKGNYWFNASNQETGWARFATLSYFNQHGNGLLVKDVCLVEAEVIIHGIASAL